MNNTTIIINNYNTSKPYGTHPSIYNTIEYIVSQWVTKRDVLFTCPFGWEVLLQYKIHT